MQVSRLGCLFPLLAALVSAQERYRTPPEPILSLVLAEDAPSTALCPDKVHLLMVRREAMPSIETAARPHLKLAGARIDPLTYGPQLGTKVTKLSLRTLDDPTERAIDIPGAGHLGGVSFNADGSRFALTNTVAAGIELWVGETATAKARRIDGVVLNAVQGATLRWLPDQQTLLCSLRLPAAAPLAPAAPRGPNVSQNLGKKATVRTYQDLLQDEHDVELFVHYGTVQLATVDSVSGSVRKLGEPLLCSGVSASPDGKFLLVERTHAPFSFHVPAGQFPQETMVWTSDGTKVVTLVDQPLADTVPIGGVVTGRRSIQWVPASEHTLMWAEALDDGNPKKQVDKRDRVFLLVEPKGTPQVWFETQHRFGGAQFGEDGALVLVSEMDRQQRRARTWRYDFKDLAAAPKLLMDRSTQDAYGDPGRPMTRTDQRGRGLVRQDGTALYLSGQGASKDGDRPFLDRWDLATGEKQRLFQCAEGRFENVQGFVDDQGARILISSESKDTPPNTWLVSLQDGARKQVTTYDDPAREKLAGVRRELIKYTRKDGVPLSGQLYLPPGHQPGQKLAAFVWAYPREYNQASDAGQVRGSPHRYVRMDGISHLFMLFKGYAVLDEAAMPIVGPVESANDQFLPQLVMNGEAAVEALAARGIDRTRIAVGGHSYGAFMTANLLAHCDLFRCGIARSGAYNRTLTPFGFQNEERTLWQAPAIYAQMSPFMHADKVNEPILLIHGEDDNNPGTFPVQSQRFYAALQGHGATARLVMLPHESHGYRAKESVLHTLAEMGDWLDRWLRAD